MTSRPTFTQAHLAPLNLHVCIDGSTRTITHDGPMTDAERDCVALGLIAVDGWRTSITPAGLAVLDAVDLVIDEQVIDEQVKASTTDHVLAGPVDATYHGSEYNRDGERVCYPDP